MSAEIKIPALDQAEGDDVPSAFNEAGELRITPAVIQYLEDSAREVAEQIARLDESRKLNPALMSQPLDAGWKRRQRINFGLPT